MRGIVCNQPKEFTFRSDMKAPTVSDGEVLVQIKRVGICGTDLHAYMGNQPFFQYPRVLGHELAGEVAEIGNGVNHIKKGDRVAIIPYLHCGSCDACEAGKTNCCESIQVLGVHTDGGMCEQLVVPVEHVIQTNHLTLDHAALMEPLAIGAHAVNRAEIKPGEKVLVVGAGPIGLGVVAFAKQKGAEVTVLDLSEERLAFCKKWAGVQHTLCTSKPTEAELKATIGKMPSIVFDATGNAHSMTQAFDYVGFGGKLIYVGLVKQDLSFNDPDFHKKELTLLGSRNATVKDFEDVAHLLASKNYHMDEYITHTCELDEVIETFESWLKPESNVIKAMVHV
ncbi:zinc-binding alcohol dehydrogenase family protein [Alkalicoccobacillus porphyridii]|uniref:Zinc-binding alcohol dehydrogenase family protein n=1 Tax=Alkalicoccobacillus porphyridii TaxID=2597270 RepID=A0A554A0M7_9BACI|nr:zinc-binding alcohol dehydrogenase family protein [Alkalicoccobacillus porphyridii]TSB47238.1 zinc-binding alcohol dehydrogenase family protein [Alkalicoccobacillus porphyridii]